MEENKSDTKMSRFRQKLLGRAKEHSNEAEISSFLNGPSDELQMTGVPPPTARLQRIDTSNARRWPSPADITNRARGVSGSHTTRPRRNTTDLVVRFTDQMPEEIGFGGDEEEAPTIRISSNKALNRKKKKKQQQQQQQEDQEANGRPHAQSMPSEPRRGAQDLVQAQVDEISGRVKEMGISDHEDIIRSVSKNDFSSSGFLKAEPADPTSAAAKTQARMRAAEGMSLRNSVLIGLGSPTSPESIGELAAPSTPPSPPQPKRISPGTGSQIPDSMADGLSHATPKQSPSPRSNASLTPQLQKTPTWTLREAALAVKDDALDDFMSRVKHMFPLFNLTAESRNALSSTPLEELLIAAAWWFLKGRMTLEATIRERNPNPEVQNAKLFARYQAYVDLAKALWIVKFVLPTNGEFQKYNLQEPRSGDEQGSDLSDMYQTITTSLNKLLMSMKRNSLLPPAPGETLPPQGLDTSIWLEFPNFTPDITSLLSSNGKGSLITNTSHPTTLLSEIIPMGDTKRSFNYGRMFVDGYLMEDGIESQRFRCPCILSICRGQNESNMTLNIASQNGLVKLSVQSDKSRGLTWKDIHWRRSQNVLELKLPRSFIFKLQFLPQDFAKLCGIYDYHHTMLSSIDPHDDEVLFETQLQTFQFFDQNSQSNAFPKDPVPQCRMRLFEKRVTKLEGTGARSYHLGFRIVILTSPRTKSLSGISTELLSANGSIQYGFMRGEGGAPALMIKTQSGNLQGGLAMTFNEVQERARLHALLTSSSLADSESCFADCRLLNLSISQAGMPATEALRLLEWKNAVVINDVGSGSGVESTKTVLSERLRVVVNFQNGSLTDRINVGKGELKLRLNAGENQNELQLLRKSQEDMTIAVSDSQFSKQLPTELAELLKMMADSAITIRTFQFPSLKDLHQFQASLTGFTVLFDGTATSFAISRRRMVVPIYKKWDATTTRLQIIRKDKLTQLVAFFSNFSHGACMNFALKGTDNFETSSKGGKFVIKIVDAKFALPSGGDEKGADGGVEKGFICLDMPDYPGEHDDISISFASEDEHEQFSKALPAPVKLASRMGSIRR